MYKRQGTATVRLEVPEAGPEPVGSRNGIPTPSETAAAGAQVDGSAVDLDGRTDTEGGSSTGIVVGVILGVVAVAGLAVGAFFLFRGEDEQPFQSSLGTIDYR